MRLNDRLIWVAVGGLLLVGAFLVGILIGLPGHDRSVVRAQTADGETRSTTKAVVKVAPTPLPPPTAADLDRWEREWDARGREGMPALEIEIVSEPRAGRVARSSSARLSRPGDRVLHFRDSTSKTLPEGVELLYTDALIFITCVPGSQCLEPPLYYLQKGEDTVTVDSRGQVSVGIWKPTDNRDAFPLLTED